MLNKIKSALKVNAFLRNSIIVFAGSMGVNVLNYIFNLLAGRKLGPANYGIVVALVSFISLFTVAIQAINTITIKLTTEAIANNAKNRIHSIFIKLSKLSFVLGFVLVALIAIFSKQIGNFLQIKQIYLIIISLFILINFLCSVSRGILQAEKKFAIFAWTTFLEPVFKIIIFLVIFYLGYHLAGAVLAIVLSSVAAYLLSLWPIKEYLRGKVESIKIKNIFKYLSYSVLAFTLFSFLTFIDVILVKHYFSATDAGNYGALSNIGKIVFYVTAPLTAVMFPMISEAYEKKEKHYPILIQAFGITLLLGLAIIAVYYFIPNTVVKILFGASFLSIAGNIFYFGVAMLILSLNNLLVYYFLSIKNYKFIYIIAVAIVAEIIAISIYHQNIAQIIEILIITFSSIFALMLGYYLYLKKEIIAKRIHS